MRSATSFFNTTLLKKNLVRFWPLWAVYGLAWIYVLPLRCLLVQQDNWGASADVTNKVMLFARGIPDVLRELGVLTALIFGILAAMAVFSYLYNSRSACMIHSLPTRREGLFLTSYLSGLICLLAPNGVVWLATLAAEAPSGYVDLYTITVWLLAQSAMCLFFYSFAVFCAMFTGHILALPAFYAILNALVAVMCALADALMSPFLYGYAGLPVKAQEVMMWLTPVVRLVNDLYWDGEFGGQLSGLYTLVIYSIAGLVMTGLALLVYRARHVESAGDVVAIPLVRPLFKYGVAVCSALCLGFWLYEIMDMDGLGGLTVSLLLWAAVGYFVAEMLLRKSFRVLDAWKGCAVLLAAVGLCVGALQLDLFGYSTRLPDPDRVESVSFYGLRTYPSDSARRMEFTDAADPELIRRVVEVQRAILDQHQQGETIHTYQEHSQLLVDYRMKDGSLMSRSYSFSFSDQTPLADAIAALALDQELSREGYGLDRIDWSAMEDVWVSSLYDTEKEYYRSGDNLSELKTQPEQHAQAIEELRQALLLDVELGYLGRRYLYNEEPDRLNNTYMADLCLEWRADPTVITRPDGTKETYSSYRTVTVTLTPQAKNTLQVLIQQGLIPGMWALRTYGEEHTVKFSDMPTIVGGEDMEIPFQFAEATAVSIPVPAASTVVGG